VESRRRRRRYSIYARAIPAKRIVTVPTSTNETRTETGNLLQWLGDEPVLLQGAFEDAEQQFGASPVI
jgi:hypothetical protein